MIGNDLTQKLLDFRKDREWEKYHTPKNLAAAISIEAAELQELFLWEIPGEKQKIDYSKLQDEIADIAIFLAYLAHDTGINIADAVYQKIDKNERRYTVEKARGNARKC